MSVDRLPDHAPEPTMDAAPMARHRRLRRRLLLGVGGAVFGVTAGLGAVGLGTGRAGSEQSPPRAGATTQVTRGTLVNAATTEGQLAHGTPAPLALKATGTVTWLPAPGTIVDRGGPVARVDDRPVVLLLGDLPMYRDLGLPPPTPAEPPTAAPAPAKGRDVRQLEQNLQALGYGGFTVDEAFSASTAKAVRQWQADLGLPTTGVVGVGDVVYLPGPIRVGRWLVRTGADAKGDVLEYTSTRRVVTVQVPASGTGWASVGTRVEVILPDRKTVAGIVAAVGTEATAAQPDGGSSATSTVPVTIDLPDQAALGGLDKAPVAVRYVVEERKDVLSVPVLALVALAEGGYGLELPDGRFLAVQTGMFADGRVEVRGDGVSEGVLVRVPE